MKNNTQEWENDFRKQYDKLGLKAPKNSIPGLEREIIIDYFRKLLNKANKQCREEIIEMVKTAKDPYMFPTTQERFIRDIKQ